MKKYLIVFVMIAFGAIAGKAQESSVKPKKGSLALETGFSPFSVSGDNILLHSEQIRAIYSVSDKIGIRIGLGFSAASEISDNGQSSDDWEKTTGNSTGIAFTPGIVCNFKGTDKLTPYIGGEVIISVSSANSVVERKDYKQTTRNEGDRFNSFGVGAFSGFNYYFAKNLYVGAEVNIAFTSKSQKNTVIETTTSGKTETVEPKNEASKATLNTGCTPSLRLGWVF
ncbi:MAG: porin family protein [Tannerella sp.]|jgi:hypothetical protein|nr:porin family protein [Tannerella sp.]